VGATPAALLLHVATESPTASAAQQLSPNKVRRIASIFDLFFGGVMLFSRKDISTFSRRNGRRVR
jgi:hypothetical protein